jgi:hypothetical protein
LIVAPSSLSLDSRSKVLVAGSDHQRRGVSQNKSVEAAAGNVTASTDTEPGMEQMKHGVAATV